jgi:hypothetical protein
MVLLALLGVTAAAFSGAGVGVSQLALERSYGAPLALNEEADAVALALDAGPWLSADPGDGPTVWALAGLSCETCAQFHAVTTLRLAGAAQGVRVMVYPGPEASAEEIGLTAALAKARDWAAYEAFAQSLAGGKGAGLAPLSDQDEAEGFALWARASAERLGAMGVAIDQPVVMWRTLEGWRMLSGAAALDAGATQRAIALDLAALRP